MNCNQCGKYIPDGTFFCPRCGAYADPTVRNSREARGLAIASLVFGIASFFLFGYVFGALAILLGLMARHEGSRSGAAIAGILCGVFGISLMLLLKIMNIG